MSTGNQEPYPQNGPDWVSDEELESLAAQNKTMLEEAYVHRLAAVRRQFFGKLLAHNALRNGNGWAIIDDEEPGALAQAGDREVLLFSQTVGPVKPGELSIPLARIITNEPLLADEKQNIISQDITIMPNGVAKYGMSALEIIANNPQRQGAAITESTAPLFVVIDGKLGFTDNFQPITPVLGVAPEDKSQEIVWALGDPDYLFDRIYALDQASSILDSIANLPPRWQYED